MANPEPQNGTPLPPPDLVIELPPDGRSSTGGVSVRLSLLSLQSVYDDVQSAKWNEDLQKVLSSGTAFLGVAPKLAIATTYFHEASKDGTTWSSERERAYRTWKDSTRYDDPRELVLPQYRTATHLISGIETYRNTIDALSKDLSRSFKDRPLLANRASGFPSRTAPK